MVDDFIADDQANHIEDMCFSGFFNWYYLPDITHAGRDVGAQFKVPAFTHVFMGEQGASSFYNHIAQLPLNKKNIPFCDVKRAVAFLQMPDGTAPDGHNNIHTDMNDSHLVLLYYVNDSDGDTYFFDADDNVIGNVTPKKNRAVIFDGSIRHASSRPKHHPRCVINFNLIPLE